MKWQGGGWGREVQANGYPGKTVPHRGRGLCRSRPGCLLIPAHDLPMTVENGKPRAMGRHRVAIRGRFGTSPDETTRLALASPKPEASPEGATP